MHIPVRTIIIKIYTQNTHYLRQCTPRPILEVVKNFFTETCVNFPSFRLDLHFQFLDGS